MFDIGANVGDTTIAALQSYPNARIICFEPVKSTYKILEDRVEPFINRVTLKKFALSDTNENVEINITSHGGANSIAAQTDWHKEWNPHVKELKREWIETKRLDDIYHSFGQNYVDIVKIDVEGFELNVLEGGLNFFRNHVRCILIEISFMRDEALSNQSVFKIFSLLNELGFSLVNIFAIHNWGGDRPQVIIHLR